MGSRPRPSASLPAPASAVIRALLLVLLSSEAPLAPAGLRSDFTAAAAEAGVVGNEGVAARGRAFGFLLRVAGAGNQRGGSSGGGLEEFTTTKAGRARFHVWNERREIGSAKGLS